MASSIAVAAIALTAGCSWTSKTSDDVRQILRARLDRADDALPPDSPLIEEHERIQQTQIFMGRDDLYIERKYAVQVSREEAFSEIQQSLRERHATSW
jgi:hypothetical protein